MIHSASDSKARQRGWGKLASQVDSPVKAFPRLVEEV